MDFNSQFFKDLAAFCNDVDEEVVGFILIDNGEYKFEQKQNLHPNPKEYFLLAPKDCIFDKNAILFHSHPEPFEESGFSAWDLENQEFHCLKMVVYSVVNKQFYYKEL